MSDLDKFTLQYQVDLKDSIRKLEELHKKMAEVGKSHAESANKLKEFVSGASAELSRLVPGLDAVGAAASRMGAGFGVASVALAALAVSVKAVLALKSQYHAQTELSMEIGVSPTRIEDYQRKFVKASGGLVNRDQAAEGLKKFNDLTRQAYKDPSGPAARALRQMGVDPGVPGQGIPSFNKQLQQAGTGLAAMDPAKAQGIAGASGLSKDWLLTLQQLGPEISKVTALTADEVAKRKTSEKDVAELTKNMAAFDESVHELQINLGILVAGRMAKFVGFVADLTAQMNKDPEEKRKDTYNALGNTGVGGVIKRLDMAVTGKGDPTQTTNEPQTGGATGSWADDAAPTTGYKPVTGQELRDN